MLSMFECKVILCKHYIAVLSCNHIKLLLKKYIIWRWRKNGRRFHSRAKVSYDMRSSMIEHQQYKELCVTFYYVADITSTNVESYKIVLARILFMSYQFRIVSNLDKFKDDPFNNYLKILKLNLIWKINELPKLV